MNLKFWHILVILAVVTVALWAQNHVPIYANITA